MDLFKQNSFKRKKLGIPKTSFLASLTVVSIVGSIPNQNILLVEGELDFSFHPHDSTGTRF